MHRKLTLPCIAIGTLFIGACAETVVEPLTAIQAPGTRALMSGSRPTLFKKQLKYSDAGLKPATGRSGNASLVAQALLGRNGLTVLEVTAGVLGEPPNGTLARVQLKQFAPSDELVGVSNHQALNGSTARFELPGHFRGSRMEVQAQVTGVDGARTDVVTVTETVKLRPDVAVVTMTHEPQSVRGGLTFIGASYRELNRDVGARANCVLKVDGAPVDQAQSIWIDAGHTVFCQFLYRFPENGVHSLTVSAEGVDPGDYDPANNNRTSTITIVEPAPVPAPNDFTWDANIWGSQNRRGTYFAEGWTEFTETSQRVEFRNFYESRGEDALTFEVSGQSARSVNGPISVRFRDWVDGVLLHDDAFIEGSDSRFTSHQGTFIQECALVWRSNVVPGGPGGESVVTFEGMVSMCSSRAAPPATEDFGSFFQYVAQGGKAMYFTDQWSRVISPDFEETFVLVGEAAYDFGIYAFGNEVSFELVFTGGDRQLVAQGVIPIVARDVHDLRPYECQDFVIFSTIRQHICEESNQTYRSFRAVGVGGVTP